MTRCVNKTYLESHYLETFDKNDIPTLGDFEVPKINPAGFIRDFIL